MRGFIFWSFDPAQENVFARFFVDKSSWSDKITSYVTAAFSAVRSEGQRAGRTENTQGSAVFFVDKAAWFCTIA